MKRRSFVQLLLALAGVPFLPKAASKATVSEPAIPVGAVLLKSGPLPNGWLPCDGRLISRLEHQPLFSVLDTAYGKGDGRTTFALPDLNTSHIHGIRDPGHRHGTELFCDYIIKAK
jgi:hypothetical protein